MQTTQERVLARMEAGSQPVAAHQWLWSAFCALATALVYWAYGAGFALSEHIIFLMSVAATAWVGWQWRSFQWLTVAILGLSLAAIMLYEGDLTRGESVFWLKYFLSSQSAVMWMSALFMGATLAYLGGLLFKSEFAALCGTRFTQIATIAGLTGLGVRWHESYLLHPDIGYIPVANLYEVFILFAVVTALIYLYYEFRLENRSLGFFALLIISASVLFLLWYHFDREAHHIRPLVPALRSYWMKIHVPTNFIGYGAFALAAMLAVFWLVQKRLHPQLHEAHGKQAPQEAHSGVSMAAVAPHRVEDLMYRCIALGFAFFTVATILGALWAAEAWGGYWSWDPKETWALIVWLNYAAWLHLRLTHGWRGAVMAWWAVIGLFVTTFCFLGVNIFLSGLHSYGQL